MRLRWELCGLTIGGVVLAALGLQAAAPPASGASAAARPPRVWGPITYPCRVTYIGGFFPELCSTSLAPAQVSEMTYDRGSKSDPAWSPDGTRLAFVRGATGNGEIYIQNWWGVRCTTDACHALGKSRRIASGGEPAWSPSGARIAFVSRRGGNADIYLARDRGGGERRLTTSPADETQPAWSPNGKTIAFTRASTIRLVGVDGSNERSLGPGSSPAWTPDGKRLAFEQDGDIWVMNVNGTRRTRLTSTPNVSETSPSWSPHEGALAFAGRSSDGVDTVFVRHPSGVLQRIVISGDMERPFTQLSVDWQPVRVLVATVSARKPIVSFRDAAGRRVSTVRAGAWALAYVDRSRRHGIRLSTGPLSDLTVPWVGTRWRASFTGKAGTLQPGTLRYWCPRHPQERGTLRIVDRP